MTLRQGRTIQILLAITGGVLVSVPYATLLSFGFDFGLGVEGVIFAGEMMVALAFALWLLRK